MSLKEIDKFEADYIQTLKGDVGFQFKWYFWEQAIKVIQVGIESL